MAKIKEMKVTGLKKDTPAEARVTLTLKVKLTWLYYFRAWLCRVLLKLSMRVLGTKNGHVSMWHIGEAMYDQPLSIIRWLKNGDHPKDFSEEIPDTNGTHVNGESFLSEGQTVRYYRDPNIGGELTCPLCDRTMHDHGWIEPELMYDGRGTTVCPGDWVVEFEGDQFKVYSKKYSVSMTEREK